MWTFAFVLGPTLVPPPGTDFMTLAISSAAHQKSSARYCSQLKKQCCCFQQCYLKNQRQSKWIYMPANHVLEHSSLKDSDFLISLDKFNLQTLVQIQGWLYLSGFPREMEPTEYIYIYIYYTYEESYQRNWLTQLGKPAYPTVCCCLQAREPGNLVMRFSSSPRAQLVCVYGDGGGGWGSGVKSQSEFASPRTWSNNVQGKKKDVSDGAEREQFPLWLGG